LWECVQKRPVKDLTLILLFNVAQNKICVSCDPVAYLSLGVFRSNRELHGYAICAQQEKKFWVWILLAFYFRSEDALVVCVNKDHRFLFQC